VAWWRRAAIWPVAVLLRTWWRTIRIDTEPSDLALISQQGQPVIFLLWHNRLFLTPEIVRRFRGGHPIYGLVSASGDGGWLAALFQAVGMGAIRGSSSRLGREAAAEVIEAVRAGCDVGITPDGPRGPVYVAKPGAFVVAKRTRAVIAVVGMEFSSAWRVASWDGFYLPKPFSRMRLRMRNIPATEVEDTDAAVALGTALLVETAPDHVPAPARPPRRRG
jgi:lysophospholipid acyltransferase (LPLAT)-like uncharacterized protein